MGCPQEGLTRSCTPLRHFAVLRSTTAFHADLWPRRVRFERPDVFPTSHNRPRQSVNWSKIAGRSDTSDTNMEHVDCTLRVAGVVDSTKTKAAVSAGQSHLRSNCKVYHREPVPSEPTKLSVSHRGTDERVPVDAASKLSAASRAGHKFVDTVSTLPLSTCSCHHARHACIVAVRQARKRRESPRP